MIHDQLLRRLSAAHAPVTTSELASALGFPVDAEHNAIVEVFAILAPEVERQGLGWVASTNTKARRVLSALHAFVNAHPDKRIFRVSAAIGHLVAQDQPTESELDVLLKGSSDFQLLPNAMIKRIS